MKVLDVQEAQVSADYFFLIIPLIEYAIIQSACKCPNLQSFMFVSLVYLKPFVM